MIGPRACCVLVVLLSAFGCSRKEKEAGAAFQRGLDAYERQDYDAAIKEFTDTIHLKPSAAQPYANRGLAYMSKKEYSKAIADFSEAIRRNPGAGRAYSGRGIAYARLKEYDRAVADSEQAIRLEPSDPAAHNNLAFIRACCPRADLRNGAEAVARATAACELTNWKAMEPLQVLAAAYAECGDFKKAIEWQEKAIELGAAGGPDGPDPRQLLSLYQEGKPYRED